MPSKLTARLSLAACMLLLATVVIAQTTITGKVTSGADKQPIFGATVSVKGSTVATQTNKDGVYTISVPADGTTLVISFIGYDSKEIDIAGKTTIDVEMSEKTSTLTDVVVTGYTSQARKDITGSVSVVKVSDLLSTPNSDASSMLQGRAAGVNITNDNSPGAGAKVRIRGFGSFGNNDPLYVIDGVPGGSLVGINPNDIESMQILKDAASASVYGSRASNGVVIVTTKKGRQGVAKVTYDMYYGVQDPGKGYDNLLNPQEMADLMWLALKNSNKPLTSPQYGTGATPRLPDYILAGTESGVMAGNPAADPSKYDLSYSKLADAGYSPYLIVPANKQGTNWYKEVTDQAPITSHNLTVSGGAEKSRYLFSVNYFDQDGILKNNFYKRYTVRLNTEFSIKNNIRIGENLQVYTAESNIIPQPDNNGRIESNNFEGTLLNYAYRMQPIVPVFTIKDGDFAGTAGKELGNAKNPVAIAERQKKNRSTNLNIFGNAYLEIDFLKHLTARTSFGMEYNTYNYYNYPFIEYENAENERNITYIEGFGRSRSWTWTNTLLYKNTFGDHDLNVLIGTEAIEQKGRQVDASRTNYFTYTDYNFITLNSAGGTHNAAGQPMPDRALFSYFGKVDYSFRNRYLASITVRRDGSSAFGSSNRYGTFPAGSLGWRISEEEFMKNIRWLRDLKIRGSYGSMGNQRIEPTNQYTQFAGSGGASFYDIAGLNSSAQQGFMLSFLGNGIGKWESQKSLNIGFDATLFNGNTEIVFDWYQRKTTDLLFPVEQPGIGGGTGSANPPFFNVGNMKNTGIDVGITQRGNIGGKSGVRFDATLTFTTYKNEITGLAEGVDFFDFNSPGNEENRVGGRFTRNAVGEAFNSYFGYRVIGLFQDAQDVAGSPAQQGAAPGRFKYFDANGDKVISPLDRVFMGSPNPDFSYGLNLNLGYKAFDVSMFFYGVAGKEAINYVRWWTDFYPAFLGSKSKDALYNSWTPERRNAKVPIQENEGNFSTNNAVNSYLVENAGFFRMKNLSIGYTLPTSFLSKFKIDKLRIYAQATNLFTVTKYTGLDPEMTGADDRAAGIDLGGTPTVRQYLVGLNLNF